MNILEKIKEVRKKLHNTPEISGAEEKTKDIIKSFLSEYTDLYIRDYNGGIIALYESGKMAEVWVTVRSRTDKDFRRIKEYLEYVVKKACDRDGLTYSVEIQDEFPATVNDKECAEKVVKCCNGRLFAEPMRWSEDFGHYINGKYTKGAFIGIGAGNCPDLHTKDYEYPDDLLENHIKTFIILLNA